MGGRRVWRECGRAGAPAVGITVLQLGAALTDGSGAPLSAAGAALIVGSGLALCLARRLPATVLLLVSASMAGYELLAEPGDVLAFPVMAAVYSAVRRGRRAALCAPVLALAAAVASDVAGGSGVHAALEARFLLAGWLVAAATVGQAASNWEAYLEQVEQRAAEAERGREEAALRRAGEERLRIARELHDSLTHSISVIKVQAGVAVHLARKRGEEVPAALLAIQEAGADASRELRSTLGVLRSDDPAGGGGPVVSGLDRLDVLVERARSAGLRVLLTVEGGAGPLPEETDRAAYRIVQEALTNAARHAGPSATARVLVRHGPERLTLRIEDDGRAAPGSPHVPGTGLIGMRERVTALAGQLSAGARPDGGFAVEAVLPLPLPLPPGRPADRPAAPVSAPLPQEAGP
ncbi:sensor histidine kinase [Streptomyces sp. NRRL S-1868]|uniref:sensor histidine kinase n=1 Tax=Streptomyces sp. NRRL S-1868 TaxID=1463892 RepID=UPI00099DC82A|nr:histidine kinase [Streptomyces sp. NRRL S-1868]